MARMKRAAQRCAETMGCAMRWRSRVGHALAGRLQMRHLLMGHLLMGRLLMGRLLMAAVLTGASAGALAQAQRVSVPSLDRDAQGGPVMLLGHWSPSSGPVGDTAAPKPARGAMLLLHGCSGPYDTSGRLGSRMVSYTGQLNRRGWSVLVLDSFTTRGERELCTQPLKGRRITQAHRRLDAWGALAWLAAQPGVDSARLGLLGWSNGGSTVLATIDAARLSRRPAEVPLPAFAVAYYPGCAEALQGGHRPTPVRTGPSRPA
jgi:hypothetical protein